MSSEQIFNSVQVGSSRSCRLQVGSSRLQVDQTDSSRSKSTSSRSYRLQTGKKSLQVKSTQVDLEVKIFVAETLEQSVLEGWCLQQNCSVDQGDYKFAKILSKGSTPTELRGVGSLYEMKFQNAPKGLVSSAKL